MPFLALSINDGVSISIDLATFFILLLNDLDIILDTGIALHTVPHTVSLVVHVIDAIPVHFGASIDDLPRPDPLFVIFLLSYECLHVVNVAEIVYLEGVLSVYFLQNSKSDTSPTSTFKRAVNTYLL